MAPVTEHSEEKRGRRADASFVLRADDRDYVRRLIMTVLVAAVVAAIWLLSDLLLLLFAAILLALLLRTIADPIAGSLGVGEGWGLTLAALLITAVLGGTAYLFGSRMVSQLGTLADRLPQALAAFSRELHLGDWQEIVKSGGSASTVGSLVSRMLSWSSAIVGALASVAVVVFAGIYLAIEPRLYTEGFLKLVPPARQSQISAALHDCAEALKGWLGAQLIAMISVGALTTIGLLLAGTPSPFALGLIAGVADAIPYVGPIAAAIPGLIVAGSQDASTLGWTLAVYVAVQQIENNLLMPLLARKSVSIPPALAIFGIVAMGVIFGPLGLLLGFPLSVALYTIVKRLYVHDTLGEPVEGVGDGHDAANASPFNQPR